MKSNPVRHTTARYFLEGLQEAGIKYLFSNLGTDHVTLIDEMARMQAEGQAMPVVVLCPHENVAIHMSAGYAAVTGQWCTSTPAPPTPPWACTT